MVARLNPHGLGCWVYMDGVFKIITALYVCKDYDNKTRFGATFVLAIGWHRSFQWSNVHFISAEVLGSRVNQIEITGEPTNCT